MTLQTINGTKTIINSIRPNFPPIERLIQQNHIESLYLPTSQLPEEINLKVEPEKVSISFTYAAREDIKTVRTRFDLELKIGCVTGRVFFCSKVFDDCDVTSLLRNYQGFYKAINDLRNNSKKITLRKHYLMMNDVLKDVEQFIKSKRNEIEEILKK